MYMYYVYIYTHIHIYTHTYIHICMYIKYIEGETTKTFLSLESWLYLRVLWQWPCCSGRRRPSYPLYNIHIYITYTIYKYTNSLYHYITLKIFRYTKYWQSHVAGWKAIGLFSSIYLILMYINIINQHNIASSSNEYIAEKWSLNTNNKLLKFHQSKSLLFQLTCNIWK